MGSGGDPPVQKFLLFTVAPVCSLRCFAVECVFFFDLDESIVFALFAIDGRLCLDRAFLSLCADPNPQMQRS